MPGMSVCKLGYRPRRCAAGTRSGAGSAPPSGARRLVAHAFEDLGCSAVWCGCLEGNARPKRHQEKCGFRFHHVEEDVPCSQMGDVRTVYFSRLTREDWVRRTRTTRATVRPLPEV